MGGIYILDTNGEEKEITADESGCIIIEEEWFGRTLELRKTENGTTTLDSDKTDVELAARPARPKIEWKQNETIKDKENGIIGRTADASGLDLTTLEYSTDDGKSWKDVTTEMLSADKASIVNRAAGNYLFRVPACNTAPYGKTTKITIDAGKTLTVSFEENGGSEVAQITGLSWHDVVAKPEDPVREGYAFEGWYKDASCSAGKQWHFKDESTGGTPDKMEADTTLYAKWKDTAAPALSVVLRNPADNVDADGEDWYNSLSAAITYSDNEEVTALYVGMDLDSEAKKQGSSYTELSLIGGTESGKGEDGSTRYLIYHDSFFSNGEHTYTFMAVDAAGNASLAELTAKLDIQKPSLGTATFKEGHRSFWDWIVGKKTLQIIIPVTETLSGIGGGGVKYTLIPDGGTAQSAQSAALSGSSEDGYTATISIALDFKGKIEIIATDNVGNVSETQTIGADGNGINGVIVEENAPEITILADRAADDNSSTQTEDAGIEIEKEKYYNSAPRLYVKVTDVGTDSAGKITSGLKSVTWKIDGVDAGAAHDAVMNFGADIMTEHSFTITALEGLTDTVNITVTAIDQAGNKTEMPVTVKIKSREVTPAPKIDYINEKLTNLVKSGTYKLLGTDGNEREITADESGCIIIEEEWFGRTFELRKKENGITTLDSEKTDVKLEARPALPKIELKQNETIKDKKDGIIGMVEGVSDLGLTTLEYSTDNGESWKRVTADRLTGGEMQNCAAGAWRFRVPACNTAPYGETEEITITAGKALTVSFEENGGNEVAQITGLSWHDAVDKPKDPVREGYVFEGWYKDENCSDKKWQFKDESTGGTPDKMEADTTLYAKWKDTAAPALSVVLRNPADNVDADGEDWYNSLSAAITYSDNEGVTALYVGMDLDSEAKKQASSYTELFLNDKAESGTGEDGSARYLYDELKEGEHTYTFRAVDAVGNETTVELTARLDTTAPVMGTATYGENPANLWDWIIGKDSMLITVPLTDNGQDGEPGSGVETVDYTLITADAGTDSDADSPGSGAETVDDTLTTADTGTDSDADSPDSGADSPGSVEVVATGTAVVREAEDGTFTAEITVLPDFKGKVKVSALDKAGNLAEEKTLGVDGSGKKGIIVEDNAPDICFSIGGGEVSQTYYDTAPVVDISVDDTGSAKEQDGTDQTKTAALITGGIASVTCTITDGSRTVTHTHTPDTNYEEAMKESDSFAIPADKLFTGVNTITVTAVDNAGNKAEKSIAVKVKKPHKHGEDDTHEGSAGGIDTPDGEKSSETPEVTPPQPEKKPEKPQREDKPEKNPEEKPQPESTDALDQGGTRPAQTKEPRIVLAFLDDGKIVVSGEPVSTGSVDGMGNTSTVLKLEDGAVIVTVVCEEQKCTAGVADTVAVANAVLTPEQIQLAADGETIEIRIDVEDISDKAPQQDKDVIERGIKENRKEMPNLTIGMYVDISMFIKIGESDWNTITHTEEPVDVVIGIPETLKAEGREFTIIRSHDGTYALLPDLDDNPDTITISTDMFSAYAIAYEPADAQEVDAGSHKCGLCHICPTFLGICCFIWLAVIVIAVLLIIWILMWRKRKEEGEKGL